MFSHHLSSSMASHFISTESNGKNLVFSPLSIHVMLGLIAAGSGGPTRDQLLAYFKTNSVEQLNMLFSQQIPPVLADGSPLGGPLLSTANGVWVDQSLTFKPNFQRVLENDYKAASKSANFLYEADEVREEVNAWADKKTNGLIKEILPPGSFDSSTRLVFANSIYFKGTWKDKFKSSRTKHHKFYLLYGRSIQTPFMTSDRRQLISAFDGFKVLTLPYKQGQDISRRFSMHIFLPDAKDGLPSLVEKLGSEVDFIKHHLPREYVDVGKFLVPKFKMNFGLEATEVLKGHGLGLPFKGGLTEMVGDHDLHVSNIFHKSFIEVNEEGTEAAAATAVVLGSMYCDEEDEIDFVADHPFMFVVREDVSGVVIFIGQLTNPKEGQ